MKEPLAPPFCTRLLPSGRAPSKVAFWGHSSDSTLRCVAHALQAAKLQGALKVWADRPQLGPGFSLNLLDKGIDPMVRWARDPSL